MTASSIILGLYSGRIQPMQRPGKRSAIRKQPLHHPLAITSLGFADDEHADPVNHGGEERALLQYASEHYVQWQAQYPDKQDDFVPPGFGENISAAGMNEQTVCIGDSYRLGTARVQVSQPRSPCWKLNERFGIADLAKQVQDRARCGWFYRVLDPGMVAVAQPIELLERPHPGITIAHVMHTLYGNRQDNAALGIIAELAELSPNWRAKAERRLARGQRSDDSARLFGNPD